MGKPCGWVPPCSLAALTDEERVAWGALSLLVDSDYYWERLAIPSLMATYRFQERNRRHQERIRAIDPERKRMYQQR